MEELRSVSVSDFKAHCLQYLEQASSLKIECVVTKRGKPIAKLIPIENQQQPFEFGSMRGSGSIKGDVIEPINTDWEIC
jgi:prevent-host-death family protein